MDSKIRLGILGGGTNSMIGILHRIASSMHDQYEIVGGVFNSSYEKSLNFAENINLPTNRVYKDLNTLIKEELKLPLAKRIQVISVLTPNHLHFDMVKKVLENGFHVICEKPFTTSYQEAQELEDILKLTNNVLAVTYTYTGYPMVRQMRKMIHEGILGEIHKIDVQYYQGWLNPILRDEKQRKAIWRLNPETSGLSCSIGDIGTHAFNMIEYVTGLRVTSVLADLNYLVEENEMDVDGTIMIKCSNKSKGLIRVSQIATGEENNFTVQIYGDKAGIKWEQENPNILYLMEEGEPKQILTPGNSYNSSISLESSKLPPGHPEGIFDAMANIYHGVAKAIKKEAYSNGEFPSIVDGLRGMNFIEKVLESHKKGNIWTDLTNK